MNEWTPELVKMVITLIVTNIAFLIMVCVWAYLSIKQEKAVDISYKFIAMGAVLAGPDVVRALIEVKDILIPVVQNAIQ